MDAIVEDAIKVVKDIVSLNELLARLHPQIGKKVLDSSIKRIRKSYKALRIRSKTSEPHLILR